MWQSNDRVAPMEGRCQRSLRRRRRNCWIVVGVRRSAVENRYRPSVSSNVPSRERPTGFRGPLAVVVRSRYWRCHNSRKNRLRPFAIRRTGYPRITNATHTRPPRFRRTSSTIRLSSFTTHAAIEQSDRDPERGPDGEVVEPPGRETAVHAGHETLVAAVTSTDRPPLSRCCQPPPQSRHWVTTVLV